MIGTALTWLACGMAPITPTGAGGGDRPIVIECKPEAEIRGADVLLQDLALIHADDAELAQRLLALSFGRRPAFGFGRVLSQQDVLARLAREGLETARVELRGATQIALHPIVTRLAAQDLLDAADPVLRAALELEAAPDIEFEPASAPSPLLVPPGRYTMELSAKLRNGKLEHSSAMIDVAVLVDGEEFKVVRIPYRLKRYHQVVVATKPVEKNAPLGPHNVELRRVEASAGATPWLTGFEALDGKVAARDLRVGQMLTLGSLADPAVVLRGDVVNLVAINGRTQVATRAIALQDGAIGNRIAVKNLTANRPVQATVHGRGLVVIAPLVTELEGENR